jgi:hypothetical protein
MFGDTGAGSGGFYTPLRENCDRADRIGLTGFEPAAT